MIKRLGIALVLGILFCSITSAAPLLPPLGATPVAGESTLTGPAIPRTPSVDWIVTFTPGDGLYNYYYQVESPIDAFLTHFTVFHPIDFVAFGQLFTTDIDADFIGIGGEAVRGHTAANYPNLGPAPPPAESEPTVGSTNATSAVSSPPSTTWDFAPGLLFESSTVLWGRSPNPPAYGAAEAVSFMPSGLYVSPDLVPVPGVIPEPSTAALAAVALGLGWIVARRRRAKRR